MGTEWYIEKAKDRIPAFAEERPSYCREMLVRNTPQERPSHGKKVLGGIEKKYSGGGGRGVTELRCRNGEPTISRVRSLHWTNILRAYPTAGPSRTKTRIFLLPLREFAKYLQVE